MRLILKLNRLNIQNRVEQEAFAEVQIRPWELHCYCLPGFELAYDPANICFYETLVTDVTQT